MSPMGRVRPTDPLNSLPETCRSSWAAIQLTFVKTGSRPLSDTRITELDAGKRAFDSSLNRATTAGCLTPTGHAAYRQTGPSGLPLVLRLRGQAALLEACSIAAL